MDNWRKHCALALSCLLLPVVVPAALIDKVEPPFWWQGFAAQQVQLLVHGDDIARFEPSIEHDHIAIASVEHGDSENYLFIYLTVDSVVAPAEFDIVFRDGEEVLRHRYTIRERNGSLEFAKGFSAADAIYLITPDRFANGNPANDTIEGFEDAAERRDPFGRHGGDLSGIRQHLDYIAGMGFTQIWLNPVLENAMPQSSYHGYATTDFYAVDPRFGNNEDYRDLVRDARDKGLGVIMDMVPNHCGAGHRWLRDPPFDNWINSSANYRETSHARTSVQDPYASDHDKAAFTDGWFSPAMPDLDQRNPLLRDYLIQNAIWWIEYLGLSGIRVDTYSYSDKAFLAEWTRRILQEYPALNIVGEEWITNPAVTSYWQAGKQNHDAYVSHLPALMDFPLQNALARALTADEPSYGSVWTPVYEVLGNDFLYPDPYRLVIFPDNHDMSRIYTQLGEDLDLWRMAIVYYLTMRGTPQFFYGTEILMSNTGTDSHGVIRSDFPGGWRGDPVNAFSRSRLDRDAADAQLFMQKLLQWRKTASVVHHGKLMQFTPVGNVYAYFRYDDDDTIMAIFNRGERQVELDLQRFVERIGIATASIDVISGRQYLLDPRGTLSIDAKSTLLLEFLH